MQKITISKFKATCLSLVEYVRRTGQTIIITKRGKPIAQVTPLSQKKYEQNNSFGCMSDTAKQLGDIVEPIGSEHWEAIK